MSRLIDNGDTITIEIPFSHNKITDETLKILDNLCNNYNIDTLDQSLIVKILSYGNKDYSKIFCRMKIKGISPLGLINIISFMDRELFDLFLINNMSNIMNLRWRGYYYGVHTINVDNNNIELIDEIKKLNHDNEYLLFLDLLRFQVSKDSETFERFMSGVHLIEDIVEKCANTGMNWLYNNVQYRNYCAANLYTGHWNNKERNNLLYNIDKAIGKNTTNDSIIEHLNNKNYQGARYLLDGIVEPDMSYILPRMKKFNLQTLKVVGYPFKDKGWRTKIVVSAKNDENIENIKVKYCKYILDNRPEVQFIEDYERKKKELR